MNQDLFNTLPHELLMLIFEYLSPRTFLDLVSTSKEKYNNHANEWAYWHRRIHADYQISTSLVAKHQGDDLRTLYKRLNTKSRAFIWGMDTRNQLNVSSQPLSRMPESNLYYPHEVLTLEKIREDLIDVQCGQCSTSFLTRDGKLHVAGSLTTIPQDHGGVVGDGLSTLRYPKKWKLTSTKQYSHGKDYILALSGDGDIWCWTYLEIPAVRIKFLHHNTSRGGESLIKKVVAGFSVCAALILGTGIVVWSPVFRDDQSLMADAILVMQTAIAPSHDEGSDKIPGADVLDFIVLECLVVWITSSHEVFASSIIQEWVSPIRMTATFQITLPNNAKAINIQGWFRTFAIFTDNDEVLILTQKIVTEVIEAQAEANEGSWPDKFIRLPSLQKTNVVSMAFGNWYFLALHAQGYITSYGHDDGCGGLGLTDGTELAYTIRGFEPAIDNSGTLKAQAYIQGRRIWFEDVKRRWLTYLLEGGVDPSEAEERMELSLRLGQYEQEEPSMAISDWIEQESRDWEAKYQVPGCSKNVFKTHHVWKIAVGTWHSAALAIVDDDLGAALEKATMEPSSGPDTIQYKWEGNHFPRLKLRDGTEMPGNCEINEWRYGRPQAADFNSVQIWD